MVRAYREGRRGKRGGSDNDGDAAERPETGYPPVAVPGQPVLTPGPEPGLSRPALASHSLDPGDRGGKDIPELDVLVHFATPCVSWCRTYAG